LKGANINIFSRNTPFNKNSCLGGCAEKVQAVEGSNIYTFSRNNPVKKFFFRRMCLESPRC
jgi:hypothetical protein